MLRPFQIHQPETVEAASETLIRLGTDAAVYGGGTELLLAMKSGFLRYGHLVDIKSLQPLQGISYRSSSETLDIGALTSHRELELSPLIKEHLAVLAELERQIANVRVRSQGTLGGNLCFAEPHSDPATLLLVLDAEVLLQQAAEVRKVSFSNFVLDAYTTALRPGELLTRVHIKIPGTGVGVAYRKFGIHERPTIGAAALVRRVEGKLAQVRVAVGCVEPRPMRLSQVEVLLQGCSPDELDARLGEAAHVAGESVDAVDDLHGSVEYKKHLTGVLVQRVLRNAWSRSEGGRHG